MGVVVGPRPGPSRRFGSGNHRTGPTSARAVSRGSSLPAWLSSILRNLFFDGYRKERAYVSADFRDVAAEPVDHEIQPWDLLEYRDLWEATSSFHRNSGLIYELAYARDLSHRDIARELGIKVSTVATRLFRVRARLRVLLFQRFEQKMARQLLRPVDDDREVSSLRACGRPLDAPVILARAASRKGGLRRAVASQRAA